MAAAESELKYSCISPRIPTGAHLLRLPYGGFPIFKDRNAAAAIGISQRLNSGRRNRSGSCEFCGGRAVTVQWPYGGRRNFRVAVQK